MKQNVEECFPGGLMSALFVKDRTNDMTRERTNAYSECVVLCLQIYAASEYFDGRVSRLTD